MRESLQEKLDKRQAAKLNGRKAATEGPAPASGFRYAPVRIGELAKTVKPPSWLVSRVIAEGQPCVVGGATKTLKTSIALDLAVSIASGAKFLGEYEVHRPRKVLFFSGESGDWTTVDTVRRVCSARGLDLDAIPLDVQFELPRLSSPDDMLALAAGVKAGGVEVCFIDPLYLTLDPGGAAVDPANVYAMGGLLRCVSSALVRQGVTPVMVHHSKKGEARSREPMELSDLAYAGIQEFARQWLLVSRREAFASGEGHKLWVSAGGSIGHSFLVGLDVDEGQLGDDFTGRHWHTSTIPAEEAREEMRQAARARAGDAREHRKEETEEKREAAFLEAMHGLAGDDGKAGVERIKARLNWSGTVASRVISTLAARGLIEETTVAAGGKDARAVRATNPFTDGEA